MKVLFFAPFVLALATNTLALAQTPTPTPAANPVVAGQKLIYGYASGMLLRSAEKMPADNYNFKPTPDVRGFGAILGHVADSQYAFCSAALGEKAPESSVEKTKTTKADLIQALKDAFTYCNKAQAAMNETTSKEMVKSPFGEQAKMTMLSFNSAHTMEHYGNIVTYLRLKGIVPPSTEAAHE